MVKTKRLFAAIMMFSILATANSAMALEYVNLLGEPVKVKPKPPKVTYALTYKCRRCSKVHNGGIYNDHGWAKLQSQRYQAQGYAVTISRQVVSAEPPRFEIRYDITYQHPYTGKWYHGGYANAGGKAWAVARGKAIEARGYKVSVTARRVQK